MESYLGISVLNKSISPNSGEVGVITDNFFIHQDKNFAFSWKIINYSSTNILDAIYIIKEDGTRIKLPDINLNHFEVVNIFGTKEERLCYIKYKSDFSGTIKLQIGRKQILADQLDIKAFDIRHLLFERGIDINTWRPKLESVSKQLLKFKSEIKQLADRISFTVTREDFNDLGQKIGDALSKLDLQANQIQNTVTVDNLTSYLRQDAEAIMIGFNDVSDSVSITRKGIRVLHEGKGYTHMGHEEIYQTDNTAGVKLLSLYNGAYRCFRHDDGRYLGYFGSTYRIDKASQHHAYGMQIAGAYPCWYTAIGFNDNVYNPSDESMTGFKSAFEVVFFEHIENGEYLKPGTHIRHGRLDLHNHSIHECGMVWFHKSDCDAVYKHEDGTMTIQCENAIRFMRNSSKAEHREALLLDFPNNEIKMNMNLNGQGYTIYNTEWYGTYENNISVLGAEEEVESGSILDTIEVVHVGKELKLSRRLATLELEEESIQDNTFDYSQLIYSLVDEVKKLKEEIKALKST